MGKTGADVLEGWNYMVAVGVSSSRSLVSEHAIFMSLSLIPSIIRFQIDIELLAPHADLLC